MEKITAYRCEDCWHISTSHGPPLYDCDCGIFNQNFGFGDGTVCPECGKLATKVADRTCRDCQTGTLEEVEAVQCDFCLPEESLFAEEKHLEGHMADLHIKDLVKLYLIKNHMERQGNA